jgi:hypothetical protein
VFDHRCKVACDSLRPTGADLALAASRRA